MQTIIKLYYALNQILDLMINLNVCCYYCNFNMTSCLKFNMIFLNASVLMVVLMLVQFLYQKYGKIVEQVKNKM